MRIVRYVLTLLIWMIGSLIENVSTVYSTPSVFYSQFCSLYYVYSTASVNCTATVPQTNIIRTGLVLSEYTKYNYYVGEFTAGINNPGSSATVFQIYYNCTLPNAYVRLGFFVVVIKTQTTNKYIDLIPFSWSTGTPIDNTNPLQRNITQLLSVTSLTIFTAGTAGLKLLPFITSYSMLPPYSYGVPVYATVNEIKLTAFFSGNDVIITLTAQSQTQVPSFIGLVILYNPPEVSIAVSNNLHMAFFINPYSTSTNINITTFASAFGPNYQNKCIFGLQRVKYATIDLAEYYFSSSSYGFYEKFNIRTLSTPTLEGAFFCFGNSTQCGQGATYWDDMDGDCYTPQACPLPVPAGWGMPTKCPNCTQLICLNCSVSNRSNCLSCNINSTLVNGICVCKMHYYEVTTPISTYALGKWNNIKNSLKQCILNCTLAIPNCNLTNCDNQTFCNACMTGYLLNLISTGQQNCLNCSQAMPHCISCSVLTNCTTCQTGYCPCTNATTNLTLCVSCPTLISNCITCTSSSVCIKCDNFYGLTSSNQCQLCSILVTPSCISCDNSSACFQCQPSTVLINGTCQLCNKTIYKCVLCNLDSSSNIVCSKCESGFYPSGNLCLMCMNLFDYCSDCNTSQCFSCLSPYMLGSDGKCSQCVQGYWLVSGICMNIPGCIKSISQPDGTYTCIACAQQLNFYYDKIKQKCVCNKGFTESNTKGQLMSCVNVCGDGIMSSNYQGCDDGNTGNNDGCSSNCEVETDFTCSDEPSKCILHLNISNIAFNYVYRVLGQNVGVLSFTIEPKHQGLEKIDWSKLVKFNFPTSAVDPSTLKYSYSATTGELLVTVPYNEQLQNTFLQTEFKFDPQILVSKPPIQYLGNKLNGINAPLVLEDAASLSTQKNINLISFILVLLLLSQFYLGSYFHKMIGLQTIQVIQSIYFVRMIARSVSTSILNSMNVIQYSACGYENGELFYGSMSDFNTRSMGVISPEFNAINMKQFFLLNVNLSLIPVVLALIAFSIASFRKYRARFKLIETKEQEDKDIFREMKRSAQWVYDHIVFPYVMMFNLITFFFSVEEFTKQPFPDSSYQKFTASSFPAHLIMTFITIAIYCYEIFESINNFIKYRMTTRQRLKMPISIVEKLQNDENYHDRANYHPAYVVVYLLYYLLLSLSMILSVLIKSFTYSLELTLVISIGYLFLIWVWKPYHESINSHNHFLRLYYFTFVLSLVICYLFTKVTSLSNGIYVALMYIIMCLIGLIMIIGFVRIFIEKKFRGKLQNDNSILQWNSPNEEKISDQEGKQENNWFTDNIQSSKIIKSKKTNLTLNNMYTFQNQLLQLGKKYGLEPIHDYEFRVELKQQKKCRLKLSKQDEEFVVSKIRQQTKELRENLIIQELRSNYNKSRQERQINNLQYKNDNTSPFLTNQQGKLSNLQDKQPTLNNNQITLKKIKQKLKTEWILKNN